MEQRSSWNCLQEEISFLLLMASAVSQYTVQYNDGISKTSLTEAIPNACHYPIPWFILSELRRPSGLEDSSFRDLQRS